MNIITKSATANSYTTTDFDNTLNGKVYFYWKDFFSEQTKSNFEIEIEVFYKTNTKVYFFPKDSLVIENVISSFILESLFELKTTITNIHTSSIADLLQQIIYCFVSKEINHYDQEPFLTFKRDQVNL